MPDFHACGTSNRGVRGIKKTDYNLFFGGKRKYPYRVTFARLLVPKNALSSYHNHHPANHHFLAPFHKPNDSPVSATHSRTPSTATRTKPFAPRLRPLPLSVPCPRLTPRIALELLSLFPLDSDRGVNMAPIDCSPLGDRKPPLLLGTAGEPSGVAGSEVLGRTFSPAERETKREKGTSQTRRKK